MSDEIKIIGIEPELVNDGITIDKSYLSLRDKKIAISVSINEDLEFLGFTEQHLNDISIEIARYIIANGGTTIYGGDLRINGFTNYFSEIAKQYKKSNDNTVSFINYFAPPNSKQISKEVEIDFKSKQIGIVKTSGGVEFNPDESYFPKENIEHRYIYSECFRNMREQMAQDSDARIIVGGKEMDYLGFGPGIIEEAFYTISYSKPLYIIGGFGGASSSLARIFEGENPAELTNEFQFSTPFLKDFQNFIIRKNKFSNYQDIVGFFRNFSLEKLSSVNKLSIEENIILFNSKNIHEIAYLIMKGLKSI